eukprot:gnl/Dysnectes_brevis/2728_a3313_1130.p1 GENE.gnl/Dysnectes_brevis/2728_a3313_1130~~gnl/Dysnectes_brevis/2728_a3313_1130.p1  ORF type:complete len:242 (-),score=99.52 gnl/Dysnectes_brevis/2728_a3313_1130:45-770(-)
MTNPTESPLYSYKSFGEPIFIGISGLIGAGKSTLAKALGEHLGLPVFYEPVEDNVYLQDFYVETKKLSFPMQVYLLNRRFEQHQQIIWRGEGGVQDRTIYEDSVFARMLMDRGDMTKRDYETYRRLFTNMSRFMKHPNVIVHLDVTPEESLERIKARERGCESGIPLDYLQDLHREYGRFIQDISKRIPVIKVRYDAFADVGELVKHLARAMEKIQRIQDVSITGSPMTSPAPTTTHQYFF